MTLHSEGEERLKTPMAKATPPPLHVSHSAIPWSLTSHGTRYTRVQSNNRLYGCCCHDNDLLRPLIGPCTLYCQIFPLPVSSPQHALVFKKFFLAASRALWGPCISTVDLGLIFKNCRKLRIHKATFKPIELPSA